MMIHTIKYKHIIIGFIMVLIFSFINIFLISFNQLYQFKKSQNLILKNEILNEHKKEDNFHSKFYILENSNFTKSLKSNKVEENIIHEYIQEAQERSGWRIIIPKIDVNAEIQNGTTQEIMQKCVGHFENTPILEGNVGLAAHNRGKNCDFFANIKKLKQGDKIIYISEIGKKEYIVQTVKQIINTDWSDLKHTKDNRLTLITCVENMPQYRLCVQAIEIES